MRITGRAPLYCRPMAVRRIIALLACLAGGCDEAPKPIAPIAESGELVVLTVNGPATYFEDAQGLPSGFEYDLATLFAKEINARPVFLLTDNPAKIDRFLRQGKAHVAAAALARRFFPQLEVVFNLGKPVDYAWLVSTVDKRRILEAAVPFFERIRKDGTLKRLVDRYYGHATRFSAIDAGALLEQIATELPKLKPFFEEAERVSGVDWRLIAAIGYQESHWNPLATSPTGVRGLMMLTEETADRLQVKDRLNARDSIVAGARYFALPKEALPPRLVEPDRTYLALAAYNIGIGHLEDARVR